MPDIQDDKEAVAVADALRAGNLPPNVESNMLSALQRYDQSKQQPAQAAPPAAPAWPTSAFAAAGLGEQAATQAMGEMGAGIVPGIKEGLQRLGGGVAQTFARLKDAYAQADVRRTSPQQPGELPAPTIRTETAKATAQEVLRRQLDDQEAAENLAPAGQMSRRALAAATELAPLALGPEAALPRVTTIGGSVVKNALAGGIGELFNFSPDPNSDKLPAIGLVSGIGAVAGVAPAVVPGFLNGLGRRFLNVASGRRAEEAAGAMAESMPGTQISLGQTGIPFLQIVERSAYNSEMINFYADQTDNYIHRFAAWYNQPKAAGLALEGATGTFAASRASADAALDGLRRSASSEWDAGMAEAARLSEASKPSGPGTAVEPQGVQFQAGPRQPQAIVNSGRLPIFNLKQQIGATVADSKDALANLGGKGALGPRDVRALESAANGDSLSVQDFSSLLKGLTRMAKSDDAVKRAAANKLRDALNIDIDQLERYGEGTTNSAIKQVIETRKEYKRAMTAADALGTSAAYRMLGVGEDVGDLTNSQILERFQKFEPGRQGQIREFMRKNAPDLLVNLRQQTIDDAIARSVNPTRASADTENDLGQMLDALVHKDGPLAGRLKTEGLWDAQEARRLKGVVSGIRQISNFRPTVGEGGTAVGLPEIAQNLVSRSGIFIARHIGRYLTGHRASQLLTDPRMFELLNTANRTTTGSTVNLMARTALINYIGGSDPGQQSEQPKQ